MDLRLIMNFSDYFVEDASYLRIQNVQLGYKANNQLNNRLGVDSLRLYLQLIIYLHSPTTMALILLLVLVHQLEQGLIKDFTQYHAPFIWPKC